MKIKTTSQADLVQVSLQAQVGPRQGVITREKRGIPNNPNRPAFKVVRLVGILSFGIGPAQRQSEAHWLPTVQRHFTVGSRSHYGKGRGRQGRSSGLSISPSSDVVRALGRPTWLATVAGGEDHETAAAAAILLSFRIRQTAVPSAVAAAAPSGSPDQVRGV